ncbi:MAG TPA: M20/M25/M40 family metallo-hydrolase [Clostridia bacterium]|nr:M20/M25/M40 family metallo-hydrolase [Clostridia bacterium]
MIYNIDRYINRQNIETLLSKLIEIHSPYFHEEEIMDFIYHWLCEKQLPAQYHRYKENKITHYDGTNIIGSIKGESDGLTVLLNAHLDTVNICEGWTRNPLKAEIEEDKMYGLGALDMKSGAAAMLLAIEAFKSLIPHFRGEILYTFVSDEEGPYGLGTDALILDKHIDRADIAIVTEPSSSFSDTSFPCLCLGARGGWNYTVTFTGKASHAANPELGINAISDASKVLLELEKSISTIDDKLGRGSISVIEMNGGGAACSVADKAYFTIFRHVVRGEDRGYIENELFDAVKKANIKSSVEFSFRDAPHSDCAGFEPYIVEENDPCSKLFAESIAKVCGTNANIAYFSSIGDFNHIGARMKIPTLVFGPQGRNYHMADEYVQISSVVKTAEILFDYLVRLLV